MLINPLVQIVQGSHTSDVYSRDVVLVALVLESARAAGHANSSNNAFASCKSAVSKPSVNQPYTGARRSWASWRLPCCCQRRARLVAARNSRDLACWFWAMSSWLAGNRIRLQRDCLKTVVVGVCLSADIVQASYTRSPVLFTSAAPQQAPSSPASVCPLSTCFSEQGEEIGAVRFAPVAR